MKINRLDTHDKYEDFLKKGKGISESCQEIINRRPFGDYPFYIFAHKRTIEPDEKLKLVISGAYSNMESVPSARLIWQPRLTKPKAQENSMLFRVYPGNDVLKVIWMIPDKELWDQYTKGKMMENKVVSDSINDFIHNRKKLEAREPDDLSDEKIDSIYKEISRDAHKKNTARPA